jgi:hypothetical protein
MRGKRLFLGLSSISLIVLMLLAIFLWYLVAPRLAQIHLGLPLLVGFVMALFVLMVTLGLMLLVISTFIQVNNALVRSTRGKIDPHRVLLLLPHCLQNYTCIYKITATMENCRRCGQCVVGDLAKLAEKYGAVVSIATGGTLARRVIVETAPDAIVGVACETDLTSGIQDAYPIPVFGVLNERPFGPCRNTTVNLIKVQEALRFFSGAPDTDHDPQSE